MISDYYTQTVNAVTRTAGSTDPFDTSTETLTVSDTFSAAVNLLAGNERYIAGQPEVLADYKIYTEAPSTIGNGDVLLWDSKYYRVVQEPKNTLQRNHHVVLYVRETEDV